MLLLILPASFLHCLSVCRLRRWEGGKEVKEIPQRETENKQVGASAQKRSCAVCLWNRWLNYSLISCCRFIFLSGQLDLNLVFSLIVTQTIVSIYRHTCAYFHIFAMLVDLSSTYKRLENTFDQNHLVRKCMRQNKHFFVHMLQREWSAAPVLKIYLFAFI